MTIGDVVGLAIAGSVLSLHAASAIVAAYRQFSRDRLPPRSEPGVTIVRPLKGSDEYTRACLASTFELEHGNLEVIFCVASASDPVVPLVHSLIAEFPRADARLLIGNEWISDNPKLNNLVKGYAAASHDWVVFIDSNVILPRHAVAHLLAALDSDVALISSPPVGRLAVGWQALTECAILNSYQARWQSFADAVGEGFAQGKVLMFRRSWLEQAGGLRKLALEPAEDAAATKVTRATGHRVALVDRFFAQPVGERRLIDVWDRQARWASLRRASFPIHYACEVFSFPWIPALLAASAFETDADRFLAASAFLCTWYFVETLCSRAASWPERLHHRLIRDVLLPLAWVRGWLKKDFVWHGHSMSAGREPTITRVS